MGNTDSEPEQPPRPPPKTAARPTTTTTTTRKPPTTTEKPTTAHSPSTISTTAPLDETATLDYTTAPPGIGDQIPLAGGDTTPNGGSPGGDGPVAYLAAIGGIVCVVVVVFIFGVYLWKRSRSKSPKQTDPAVADSELAQPESGVDPPSRYKPSLIEGDEDSDNPPMYTQVNKEKKSKPATNGAENVSKNGNAALEVPTPSDDHPPTSQDKSTAETKSDGITIGKNGAVSYYNVWSDGKTVVVDGQPVTKDYSGKEDVTDAGETYENFSPPVTSVEVAYETESISKPVAAPEGEPDPSTGNTYDKLDRLDRTIANEMVFDENEYDL